MKKGRIVFYFGFVIFAAIFNFYLRPVSGNPLVTSEYKKSSSYINDLYQSDEYFKRMLLKTDEYHFYEEIIKNSVEDTEEVNIECNNNEECVDVFLTAYYAVYLDHPELLSFLGIGSYLIDGNQIFYNNLNNIGKIKTFLGTRRIEREIDNIKRDTRNMTDKEKIIYVYDYIASHNYDNIFKSFGINQSIYSFFTKGSSVCAGFAKAAQIIFQNIGINSYLVLSSTHMWNYVEYKGKYYIFDATYGTSFYDNSSRYYNGLGMTTTGDAEGMFKEYYPVIETSTTLKELFGI